MTAPAAAAFRAALEERFRRTCVFHTAPVTRILAQRFDQVHVAHRVQIDARTLRVIAHWQAAGSTQRRIESIAQPVATRLAERQRRESGPLPRVVSQHQPATEVQPRSTAAMSAIPFTRPVPMVLARPAASAAPAASTQSTPMSSGWPGDSDAVRRTTTRTVRTGDVVDPPLDVQKLTDRVVAAIERRSVSARERLGR